MRFISILIIPIIMLILIGFEVLIGVYVFKDARRRGMNAALWTLIAILAPSLIGFIIYLLVRGNYTNMNCPKCDTKISEQYVICPKCGLQLKPSCPNCKMPVEPDWKNCPQCTEPLPNEYEFTTPKQPKDNLWKILIIIIAVPVILIVASFIILAFGKTGSSGGSSAMGEIPMEKIALVNNSQYIMDWVYSHSDDSKAYALKHNYTDSNDQKHYVYLIHIPAAGKGSGAGLGIESGGLFQDTLRLDFESVGINDNCLFYVSSTADQKLELNIYLNGTLIECEIEEVDFNPGYELIDFME